MEKKELKRYLIIGVIAVAVCLIVKNFGLFVLLLKLIFSAAYPLVLGCMIAYVFNIFLSFCERYYFPKHEGDFLAYTRRPVCMLFSIAATVAVLALILNIVIPEIITAVKLISSEIPDAAIKVKDIAVKYLKDYPEIQEQIKKIDIDWNSITKKAFDFITVGAGGLISSIAEIISALTITVTRLVIALIFAVYLLVRKDKLFGDVKRIKNAYLNEKTNKVVSHIYHTANDTFKNFFVGQFAEAVILGTLCMIGMYILRIPYAAMTGAVIGVTAIIPIVGAYLGAGIGAFIICTDDPMKALEFLIFLVILQQFEGNVIYPKVVGSSVGLPGIWVLAAVTIGGSFCGIMGMLLGVPLAATVYKLMHEELDNREKKLGTYSEEQPTEKKRKKEIISGKVKNNKKPLQNGKK